jgi:hypothetical protein
MNLKWFLGCTSLSLCTTIDGKHPEQELFVVNVPSKTSDDDYARFSALRDLLNGCASPALCKAIREIYPGNNARLIPIA